MKRIVTFGEIMLRLATPGYLRFSQANELSATFGGGEANVAVSLANYGMEASFVTRLPENDIAVACVKDLRKNGVLTDHIIYGGERLGIYFLETGAVARASKVIYDRAHSSISEIQPGMIDWDRVFEGADWFHCDQPGRRGCLPGGDPGGESSGRDRLVRPELPQEPLEIWQAGR